MGSVLSKIEVLILEHAACSPGTAWVFMQFGSAFTSILMDCSGQLYADILWGPEESFFCFCYRQIRGQSPCFSTQRQHFPLFFRYYFEALEEELV